MVGKAIGWRREAKFRTNSTDILIEASELVSSGLARSNALRPTSPNGGVEQRAIERWRFVAVSMRKLVTYWGTQESEQHKVTKQAVEWAAILRAETRQHDERLPQGSLLHEAVGIECLNVRRNAIN